MRQRTIGVLGCTFPATNYFLDCLMREAVRVLPKHHNPPVVLFIDNFAKYYYSESFEPPQSWEQLVVHGVEQLHRGGAEFFVCPANTTHSALRQMVDAFPLDFLDITVPVARQLQAEGITRAAVLATSRTCQQQIYDPTLSHYGIAAIYPAANYQEQLNSLITEELIRGIVTPEAREFAQSLKQQMLDQGAERIILGCTELPLIFANDEFCIDSTDLLAKASVARSCGM